MEGIWGWEWLSHGGHVVEAGTQTAGYTISCGPGALGGGLRLTEIETLFSP